MTEKYHPRYSGPNCTGICICGHSWEEHHLGMVLNAEYAAATHESYVPQECEFYGCNEVGGMKYDATTNTWTNHCHGYRDSGWPDEHN